MAVIGVDVSENDRGLVMASSRTLGYEFCTARALSYPQGVLGIDGAYAGFRDQASELKMPFSAYVLFHTYYSPRSQAQALARCIGDPQIPVMLDVEPDASDPSVQFAASCWDACLAEGLNPRTLYLPRWWWDRLGQPDLTIRGWQLISSHYGTNVISGAWTRYAVLGGDTCRGFDAYGGLTPVITQIGSQILIGVTAAGDQRYGDANVYRGSRAQLHTCGLFTTWTSTTPPTPTEDAMKHILVFEPTTPPRYWVVRADLTGRVQVPRTDYEALSRSTEYLPNPGMTETGLSHIPDLTARAGGV